MGGYIDQEKFIKELQSKWEITDDTILSESRNKFGDACKKYSVNHYISLKSALIKHLNSIEEEKRKAYINCKKLNYKSLDDPTSLDFIISIMTGGLIVSFFEQKVIEINGPIISLFLAFIVILLTVIKCFVITNRRYKFILAILEDIKEEIL